MSISSTLNARVFCTNIILAAFSSYMYLEKAAEKSFVQKNCTLNVDEIDERLESSVQTHLQLGWHDRREDELKYGLN